MSHDESPPPKRKTKRGPAPKERVLHTRVPAVLEGELKRLATNLRVPVSNVVRAILEDALDAVDNVTERAEGGLMGFVDRLSQQRDELRARVGGPVDSQVADEPDDSVADDSVACPNDAPQLLDGVFGYQSFVLATDRACSVCARTLRAGDEAHRAMFDDPGKRVFLGAECRLLPEKE